MSHVNKKIVFDPELCVGCGACVVACMDQNDTLFDENSENCFPNRRLVRAEFGQYPHAAIRFASVSCRHCADAACVTGCPTGALQKDPVTGATIYNKNLCIGCHSCAMACPFGVPRYDINGKITKCDQCHLRVAAGYEPACVGICQSKALTFVELDAHQEQLEAEKHQLLLSLGRKR